jgi:DNA-directed RNA polymerase specialized sigma24 family protein
MRRVLVDAARARKASRRRADVAPVSLDDIDPPAPEPSVDVAAIGDALTVLGNVAPRASRVVELRFFGGFSVEETAEALGVSVRTVNSDGTPRVRGSLVNSREASDMDDQVWAQLSEWHKAITPWRR